MLVKSMLAWIWSQVESRITDPIALSYAFAYAVVGGVTALILVGALTGVILTRTGGFSLTPLKMTVEPPTARTAESSGLLVVVEPQPQQVDIPFSNESLARGWLSIDPEIFHRNRDRVRLDYSGININAPLLGLSSPLVAVIQGDPSGEVLLPGTAPKAINEFSLVSEGSESYAIWVLTASLLGLGIGFGRFVEAHPVTHEQRSREK